MQLESWNVAETSRRAQFELWRDLVDRTHMGAGLVGIAPSFRADVTRRNIGNISLVECHCDPCQGFRGPDEVRKNNPNYFGILFERSGREIARVNNEEVSLNAGDIVIWDTANQTEFRVLEPLHKFSLFIPKETFRQYAPDFDRLAGIRVGREHSLGPLIGTYLGQLMCEMTQLDDALMHSAVNGLLELVSAGACGVKGAAIPRSERAFRKVKQYILQNLSDPELTPQSIANANGVSLRYLHKLFAERGLSVSSLVREQRLHECRKALTDNRDHRAVTEIAFDWGFNDGAHFSRTFRRRFGFAPREARRTSKAGLANHMTAQGD